MIPLNSPFTPTSSKEYAIEALSSEHQYGDGPFTERVSKLISEKVGGGHVLLTPSCTQALEMACMLINVGPGDEVILPSYTFTSAATAITKFGATPVFVDIESTSKGIDVNQVRASITPKTKAISWVNYAGRAPDIESLLSIAAEFNLILIEDNAHGFGGSYKGSHLGSFGDFATLSFHATKNIHCGEGGALVINNSNFIERAEIIREKGTDRSKFVRGVVPKYQWVDKGSSYLLAEVLAAVLLGQMEIFEPIQSERFENWLCIKKILKNKDQNDFVILNENYTDFTSSHIFGLEFKTAEKRAHWQQSFNQLGIGAATHYEPLHNSKAGMRYGVANFDMNNTIDFSKTLLRLPIWSKSMNSVYSDYNSIVKSLLGV
jgi:dTDP-4-amino-4,6-dideoxygalactose transaminase